MKLDRDYIWAYGRKIRINLVKLSRLGSVHLTFTTRGYSVSRQR